MPDRFKKKQLTLVLFFCICFICQCGRRDNVTTDSKDALVYYKQGEDLLAQLYYKNALKNYLNALEIDSTFAMAALKAGIIYKSFGSQDSARYFFENANKHAPSKSKIESLIIRHNWFGFTDNKVQHIATLDSLVRFYPNNFEVKILLASNKWKNLDFAGARNIYQELLRQNPNYIVAYNNIGYLYAREGLFKEALSYLEKYKRHASNQLNPYDSIAEIYIAIGRYYEVINMLENIIANRQAELIENEYIGLSIYRRIAEAYEKLGQYQKALEIIASAEGLYSTNYAAVRIAQFRFYIFNELDQVDRMETEIKRIRNLYPADDYSYQCAILNIEKMEFDDVLKTLAEMTAKIKNQSDADRYQLVKRASLEGELNYKTGLFNEAAQQFKLAADTFSDTLWASNLRLKQYISEGKAGNYSAAISRLQQIIKVNPNCPHALVNAAEFYLKLNQIGKARAYISHFQNLWKDADLGTPLINQADSIAQKLNLLH
ncbi:MAG TPA: hypothetical protein DHW42_04310 [Candidatus Marinimicrobia bacterium]|nr:hypothetical protein [Candidatus Neomarinimicrobiota bacterium]